jgi:DNA-binding transcriptional ArsR family regulator
MIYAMRRQAEASLDRALSALADPTRRAIVVRLMQGEARVTDVAAPFAMSLPAVSKHVRQLEAAGLLSRRRVGREHRLALDPAPLADVEAWLGQIRRFWTERLAALDRHLAGETRPAERVRCGEKPMARRGPR